MVAIHGPIAPRISHREKYDRAVVNVAFSKGLMMMAGSAAGGGSSGDVVEHDTADGSDAPNKTATSMKPLPVPLPSGGGATERELECFIRDALSSCIMLEKYPRCVIQVVIQIVQADGSVLGSATNCAVMALMDAGVAMRGLPVAATCVVVGGNGVSSGEINEQDTIWLDPTAEEESGEGHSVVVLVTDASDTTQQDSQQQIITSFTYGAPLSMKGLLSSVENTRQSSAAMVAFMRLAVEQKVQREVVTLWS